MPELEQGVLDLGKRQLEVRRSPYLLTEEDDGQDRTARFGVGLKMPSPVSRSGGQADQPQHEAGEERDQEQDLEALGPGRTRITQGEAPAMVLEVAEGLLDLHSAAVGTLDQARGAACMRKRSRQQPGRTMQPPVEAGVGAVAAAFPGSARTTTIGAHQVESAPVAMTLGQAALAEMTDLRGGVGIERMGIAPAAGFGLEVLDAVTDAADPIPAQGLYISEPRAAEAGIGDHDGAAAFR